MPLVNCPMCGKGLKCPDERLGTRGKCPACGESFELGSLLQQPGRFQPEPRDATSLRERYRSAPPVSDPVRVETGEPAVPAPLTAGSINVQLARLRRQVLLLAAACGVLLAGFGVSLGIAIAALNREPGSNAAKGAATDGAVTTVDGVTIVRAHHFQVLDMRGKAHVELGWINPWKTQLRECPGLFIRGEKGEVRGAFFHDNFDRIRFHMYRQNGECTIGGMVNRDVDGSLIVNGLRVRNRFIRPDDKTFFAK